MEYPRAKRGSSHTAVVEAVTDEVVGFGPIEFLLKDRAVSEVAANGRDGAVGAHQAESGAQLGEERACSVCRDDVPLPLEPVKRFPSNLLGHA